MTPLLGKKKSHIPCRPHIVTASLPYREEVILQRERNLYPLMVHRLMGMGRREKGGSEDVTESLTIKMIEDAFAIREATVLPAATFLAGRCQPDAPEFQERLTALLRDLLDSLPVDDLDIMDAAYIEAAISLALRGEPDKARQALIPLVTDYAPTTIRSYLAAFYLAQLGDPSGYSALLATLGSSNEHYRLMATRHLIGFKPYNGQTIQGKVVDIKTELVKRLKDSDTYVRREVPHLLAEAEIEGLRELLLPVAKDDIDPDVRQAARAVLEHPNDR